MKIKEIRMVTRADKATIPSACGATAADGLAKPPC
jgi:hypothetical protein